MIYPNTASLTEEQLKILCNEYRSHNYIDPVVSDRLGVKRGLRNADGTGVLAGLTNICTVLGYRRDADGTIHPAPGRLIYRGIDLNSIVSEAITKDRFMFEEVVWLLLLGTLPSRKELEMFQTMIEGHRELPDGFAETMIMSAPSPNIMNKMARSVLAMYAYDKQAEDTSLENILRQSINLIAEMPTMMVYAYQTYRHAYQHKSMYFHYPIHGLSTAEHILATYRPDQHFTHEEAKLLDLCMICHADHGGGNNSTFTDRVVSSTGTDTYSAIASAIVSLKGPRHGGANLRVMNQLDEMIADGTDPQSDASVRNALKRILEKQAGDGSGLIYGIGHAVYTESDPRAVILRDNSYHLSRVTHHEKEYDLLCMIEKLAPEVFREVKGSSKNVCANVDLYSGLIYRMMGIDEVLYTPIFAIARVGGWCAHRMEEIEFSNRIIRPAYGYCGRTDEEYVPLEKRNDSE